MSAIKINIKTALDHKRAIARITELMDKDPRPGSEESDELIVLAQLAEIYEKKHHDIGMPDAISAIGFRMEQQGLTQKDMVPYLGSPSRVSEVLNGKRPLTVQMIRNLHSGLGIPLESLVMGGQSKVRLFRSVTGRAGSALPAKPKKRMVGAR
ncbi:MAG: helix-turn-helix domain-containing protein [Prosthecobacter sp.]|nr:helix-turn-helix domain-containing protein [Prosthecobacter sp.]